MLQSLLNGIKGSSTNLISVPKSKDYSAISKLKGNNIIFSPLSQLIELPLRIRRILYEDKFHQQDSVSSDLDRIIRDLLSLATDILSKDIGREQATKWRDNLHMRIRQIIAGEGPFGLLNGGNAIVKVIEVPQHDRFEIVQELKFDFQGGAKTIAERSYRIGENLHLMEKWVVKEDFEEIFSILQRLDSISIITNSVRIKHIFFWSDMPLETYQFSFLKQIFSDYIKHFSSNSQNDAVVIVIATTNETNNSVKKSSLKAREYLALKRALRGGRMYLCPGKNEEIYTDSMLRLNRPQSVLENEKFFTEVEIRLRELEIRQLRLLEEITISVSDVTLDLVDNSSIAIMASCWKGTWSESREIDGEQVI